MKLGADAVEVLRPRSLLSLADLCGVLAAQPGLEAIRLDLLAGVVELPDAIAPAIVGGRALLLVHVREQVAFEHVCRAEGQAPVVHGLEDRVGVVV